MYNYCFLIAEARPLLLFLMMKLIFLFLLQLILEEKEEELSFSDGGYE